MSKTRPKSLIGKGLPTIVYVLVLVITFIFSSPAFAACQSSEKCDNETIENSTLSFNQYSNSTLSFDQFSNSTLLFNQFSNSTSLEENDTFGFEEQQNDSGTTNANDTSQTLPNPMDSFQFTSNDTSSITINKQDSNSLHLQGDQYVDENSTVPNIKSLTVTAWIKPDYSEGSPVFTVVSDTNEFILAVNSNMPATKYATFSVFDGIKWTTVQSTNLISEQWTHLAAIYNGTTIGIYVNGSLEKTTDVTGIPVLVDGELTTRTEQNLTSDANLTIGAYYDKTRHQSQDLFSGEISDVNLYNVALTQAQIGKIFQHAKPNDNSTYFNEVHPWK
ncbi:MAG: LamG domain-containing protein [Thaumarchaeota archaeon]|nr:LamG domain-containing protein [Nitrososphaerota archaeon]